MNEDYIQTVVLDKDYTNNSRKPAVSPADREPVVSNDKQTPPSKDDHFTQTYSYLT